MANTDKEIAQLAAEEKKLLAACRTSTQSKI